MNKLIDWKNRLKKGHMLSVICVLLIIVAVLGIILYKKQTEYRQASENSYNAAFYEVVNYVQNVETYLAKSMISSTPEHGAETLTNLWREANLAQSYLSMLPIESQELENTEKFLNQVSDYSYTLSRKNIYKEITMTSKVALITGMFIAAVMILVKILYKKMPVYWTKIYLAEAAVMIIGMTAIIMIIIRIAAWRSFKHSERRNKDE